MSSNNDTRTPQQERSKQTKNKIISTAIELFSTKGYYNTNSKEIAKEAGVSVGSFYAYFKDKKAVFMEMLGVLCEDVHTNMTNLDKIETITDASSREIFHNLIKEIFKAHNLSPELHKEITIMRNSDEEINNIIVLREKEIIDKIHSYLVKWKNHIKVGDLEAASLIIYSCIDNTICMTRFSHIDIDESRLINELTNLLLTYLYKE
ncbi:TetR/AcrR family transcriptional regulator [Clostridium sp. DJ247]|uniref:TetR/AcrR family transcriptional regulator n=1 Tax=Clostridium sp. DJ247 TaxID=2726188 RepID=UPI001629848B|nr:TetR/AcrR family transcriptional regulator [Clostridium sp. DJ247]MBC2581403.1 TetR/AcrR family transcriptional regulator [Clostridium sp. DJ247]